MKRHLLAVPTAALLIAGLAGCGAGGGVLTDAQAVSASGAKGCVKQEGKILVRAEYECATDAQLDVVRTEAIDQVLAN
jgi:hypothetical protein